jgi:hypothetical protein
LVSGLVYFLFMAAWLNAFLVVGYSRWLQVLLGLLAVTVGVINLVDVWRDSEHFTVSIPERAKPGIYQKVRAIIRADNLALALFMAAVVAVMVNFIELLCTAGIPAVYTQILAQQELETSSYYGYLLLYNLAYIFDDSVMVAIAVWTLSRAKLQAKQGRWLKLISGLTILLLGLLLWFKPSWLF